MTDLVIVAPNWLGDAVMSLPAIADVRAASPGRLIAVAARPSVAPLFQMVAGVDRTVSLDDLNGHSFKAALLLPNSFHSAFIAWRARIPERWGYGTDLRGPLLTKRVAPARGIHQAEYYQRLVHELGYPSGPLLPRLEVPAESRRTATALLRSSGWDGERPIVALAPGAAFGGAKRWPPASFAAVARSLIADGLTVVLVGSAGDARTGAEVEKESGGVINLIGRDNLPTLGGIFLHCRTVVSNDSGAMHLAAALGRNVVALFGPTNERETRPLGASETSLLTYDVWCRPCGLRECPIDHRCMRGISADAVVSAIRRTL
jgi:heptosyltransferase-2